VWREAEITDGWCPPYDLVFKQCVRAGDSGQMTVIGNVRLSPLGGVVITIT
jgi:hypothetical protein